MEIKSFVFLDLETTGLPAHENNTTKITELCLICVHADHILLGAVPRVQNKLNLCFNPWKLIKHNVENITGLSNSLLENQSAFDEKTLNLLTNFLDRLQKPVCFVAHNGLHFDYPILKTHIEQIKSEFVTNLFCIDSLPAFKELLTNQNDTVKISIKNEPASKDELTDEYDLLLYNEVIRAEKAYLKPENSKTAINRQTVNETTPQKEKNDAQPKNVKPKFKFKKVNRDEPDASGKQSARKCLNFENISPPNFKLVSVYEHLLHRTPSNLHHAEIDVQMILECAVILGDRFVNWANKNAIHFSQIQKMTPGKKITSKDIIPKN